MKVVEKKRQGHWAQLNTVPTNLNLKAAAKECDLSCLMYHISNHSRLEIKYDQILFERIINEYISGKGK